MTLRALILRLEGAVFSTGETFRLAANDVLAEAGFDHEIDAQTFALEFGHYICKERFIDYAAQFLRRRRPSEDLSTLLEITYRRIVVSAERALLERPPAIQNGIQELAAEASREGLGLAVVASINGETAQILTMAALGTVPAYAPSGLKNGWSGTALQRSADALGGSLRGLGVPPQQCLALQSSSYGLAAAEAAGVPALAIIGQSALNGGLYRARAVVDDLHELLQDDPACRTCSGRDLLAALRALHEKEGALSRGNGNHALQVHDILEDKGSSIKSVNPTDTVQHVAKRLAEENIGAMVVLSTLGTLEGIVSERDVMRGLFVHGGDVLAMPVSSIMTRAVITCSPADSLFGIAHVMTNRRIRHVPVSERGKLIGLVSIGDVLNRRLEEVQIETGNLRSQTIAR